MPKIGNERFVIDGQWGQYEIHYNRTQSFFLKDFPQRVFDLSTNYKHFGGATTESSLIDSIHRALHEYHENAKSSRKVILIELAIGCDFLMNKVHEGSYQGQKPGVNRDFANKASGAGMRSVGPRGMDFDFKVCYIINKNGEQFHYMRDDGSVGREMSRAGGKSVKDSLIIDYTPEREQFMVNIMSTFDLLALKFIQFFSNEDLSHTIDQSAGLFLTSKTEDNGTTTD